MLISGGIAEVLGVLLGDGCISRYHSHNRVNLAVAFTGSNSEFGYYEDFVKPTLESWSNVKGYLYRRKDNTTRFRIFGARLAMQLISIGIPVGRKVDAMIPSCVFESGKIIDFIRGIYHAEGSIYRRYSKRYNTHVRVYDNLLSLQIRMKLRTLMHQINSELIKLGIVTNRLTEKDGVYTLRITRQSMIQGFFEIVEPKFKSEPHPANL